MEVFGQELKASTKPADGVEIFAGSDGPMDLDIPASQAVVLLFLFRYKQRT